MSALAIPSDDLTKTVSGNTNVPEEAQSLLNVVEYRLNRIVTEQFSGLPVSLEQVAQCKREFTQIIPLLESLETLLHKESDLSQLHEIPSWLPFVVTVIVPQVGIGLVAIRLARIGAQYAGITDAATYGSRFTLLAIDEQELKKKFKDQQALDDIINGGMEHVVDIDGLAKAEDASDEEFAKAKETLKEWIKIKQELNLLKSKEGAALVGYGVNMGLEMGATTVDHFVPGLGSALKWTSYGTTHSTAAGSTS